MKSKPLSIELVRGNANRARFLLKIGAPDSNACWPWIGTIRPDGYGTFGINKGNKMWIKAAYAHRVAYVMLVGKLPNNRTLDHLCRNRACVNPAHLEPVTHKVNCLRGTSPFANNARKQFCPKGHPLSGPNLKIDKCKTGAKRRCRICANAAVKRSTQKARK